MPIKNGDTVKVHYTGSLDDGTIFDSSRERDPLEFVVGNKSLIAGFEAALMGKEVGDTVTVHILPLEAYGDVDKELIFDVPRDAVPPHITPEVGMLLELSGEEGNMNVKVLAVNPEEIILDANHPLAGKALNFTIDVVHVAA